MAEQSGWELKKMREEPHEWVDILIDHCVEVWEYMEQCDEFGDASSSVREQVTPPSSPLLTIPPLSRCGWSSVRRPSTWSWKASLESRNAPQKAERA
jgi:hypothetical protein